MGELAEAKLLEREDEQQLSDETAELEFATECPTNATGDEDNMKVQIDQFGEEEKEHTFQCAQEMEKEEHSVELLKNFSQGADQEISVEYKSTTEGEETDSMDLVDLCEEMEALERRVNM